MTYTLESIYWELIVLIFLVAGILGHLFTRWIISERRRSRG